MQCFARNTLLWALGLFLSFHSIQAQFAPPAGLPGSTAIPADSSAFSEWATGCNVQRGYMNIADTSLGHASAGSDVAATGKAGTGGIVSLGDGGVATLTFDYPIYNGDGFDFAVFENGFMSGGGDQAFLELGFVEVSSDGVIFFRFPSVTNVEDTSQIVNGGTIDGSQLYNLAGKYVADYGTPFDLQEMVDTPGLDVNNITHIRIVDVVGSIDSQYASRDSKGHIVNDPWPTAFASGGFDLDAVGVIHAKGLSAINNISPAGSAILPNPVKRGGQVTVDAGTNINQIQVFELSGKLIVQLNESESGANNKWILSTKGLGTGVYLVKALSKDLIINSKLVVE